MVTVFVLIHGLPMDWFATRESVLAAGGGNAKLFVAEVGLLTLGIARIAGWFNWIIRVFQLDMTVLALPLWALVSTLWSADPGQSGKDGLLLVMTTAYGAYLVLRFRLGDLLDLLARVFAVSGIINLAFILAFPQYGIESDGVLWDGVFFQKNALGFNSLLAIPILVVVGRAGPRWRHLYYLCLPVHFTLLIGSQSKTMLVASIASVLLLFMYRAFRWRRTLRGAALIAMLAISAVTVAVATANIEALADWLDKDVTLTGRIPLWQELIPIALENPILGHGFKATFGGYFSPVHEIWVSQGWEPTHAHNAVLQAWLDLGVVGVALMLFGILRAMIRALTMIAITEKATTLWPLVYISSTISISITESGIVNSQNGWLLYVVAALTIGLYVKAKGPITA